MQALLWYWSLSVVVQYDVVYYFFRTIYLPFSDSTFWIQLKWLRITSVICQSLTENKLKIFLTLNPF